MKLDKNLLFLNSLVYGCVMFISQFSKGKMFLRLVCSYFLCGIGERKVAALRSRVFLISRVL